MTGVPGAGAASSRAVVVVVGATVVVVVGACVVLVVGATVVVGARVVDGSTDAARSGELDEHAAVASTMAATSVPVVLIARTDPK